MFDLRNSVNHSMFLSVLQRPTLYLSLFAALSLICAIASAGEKSRVCVLTDIENEPAIVS